MLYGVLVYAAIQANVACLHTYQLTGRKGRERISEGDDGGKNKRRVGNTRLGCEEIFTPAVLFPA
jgi:hypothetical protein